MSQDKTNKFELTIKIWLKVPKGLFKQCGWAFAYVGKALADLIDYWVLWFKHPWL